MKIGFFDSGIGGLSVLGTAIARMPENEYLYYADTDHVPYGERTKDEILSFTMDGVRFLIEAGAEAVVVACNTATAVAVKALRERFDIPIVGMEPAVKPAVELTQGPVLRDEANGFGTAYAQPLLQQAQATESPGIKDDTGVDMKRVMVIATPVTLREAKLKDLLHRVDEAHRVDLLALPRLVEFAENEEWDSAAVRAYLTEAFSQYDMSRYAALVLGCTHVVFFRPLFHELFGDGIALVDGNEGTVRRLADVTSESAGTGTLTHFPQQMSQ
ncbi:MAG: aspartate/glutamate racemase family protein, partial [Lachnospiraceae bacterium]|nr:aspartate/glutamate racemase family protein [Lachnospiraceae bacterium]